MNGRVSSVLLFLIGLFSMTQVHFFGSMGISEFFLFVFAPYVFFRDYAMLRNDGFLPFVWLSILTCFGSVISALLNDYNYVWMLKGLATPYSVFATTVVLHMLLRKNFRGVKWFLIGAFISGIVCVFVFQQETSTFTGSDFLSGEEATERIVSNPLFWASKICGALGLPVSCWYLRVPTVYALVLYAFSIVFTLISSKGSGRSAALVMCASLAFLLVCGKNRRKMLRFGRNIVLYAVLGAGVLFSFKAAYKYAASTGALGEEAKAKYEKQTSRGSGALRLLMSGRCEFFVSLRACLDAPIMGMGYHAEDVKGYYRDYLAKYGDDEDIERYEWQMQEEARRGGWFYHVIPTHSYITSFWLYYGIFGLIFWLYALYLIFSYYKRFAAAIPQWFSIIALGGMGTVWNIFFSPYGGRVSTPFFFVCLLLARAVYLRRLQLPFEMEMEARKYER